METTGRGRGTSLPLSSLSSTPSGSGVTSGFDTGLGDDGGKGRLESEDSVMASSLASRLYHESH